MWYRERLAVNLDTDERLHVYTGASDWDEDISPTVFFKYFAEVPIHDAADQCLDTMNITEFMNGFPQKEKEKNLECLSVDEGQAIGGVGANPEKRKGSVRWE